MQNYLLNHCNHFCVKSFSLTKKKGKGFGRSPQKKRGGEKTLAG